MTRFAAFGLLAFSLLFASTSADAQRTRVSPYIELQEVLAADLNGGEVLTYTAIAVGADATVRTRRVRAQASYRYERRFPTSGFLSSQDIHSGLASARYDVNRNLTVTGGTLATRARTDLNGDSPGLAFADSRNLSQVFAAYVGPSVSGRAGPVSLNGAYRLGYVAVDINDDLVVPGTRRFDRYNGSVSQLVTGSAGMAPGPLPFGWTVGAGYDREDADRLDQRFEGVFVRGDVVVPISPTFALTGGIGYESIRQSQQDYRRGPDGQPLFDDRGELIAEPGRRRLRAIDIDGLIYDGGFIWQPTRRTELQLRAGHRYGGTTVTGSFRHQIDAYSSVQALLYDGISSFGRGVIGDLGTVPTSFNLPRNQLIGGSGGCIFSGPNTDASGGNQTGGGTCFDDSLQSITGANFRNRGLSAIYTRNRGVWDLGVGANYARRNYLTPDGASSAFGDVVAETAGIQASVGRNFTRNSGIDLDAYAQWNSSGIFSSSDPYTLGATGTYYRSFTPRLLGQASIGLYDTSGGNFDRTVASGLLGLRYGL